MCSGWGLSEDDIEEWKVEWLMIRWDVKHIKEVGVIWGVIESITEDQTKVKTEGRIQDKMDEGVW
jgi:hypothetical protein